MAKSTISRAGSVALIAIAVGLLYHVFFPATTIELERLSQEHNLREGYVYSRFLRDGDWRTGSIVRTSGSVQAVSDVPINLHGPKLYTLSHSALAEECPIDVDDPDMGGQDAAQHILQGTSRVFDFGERRGVNAIGCSSAQYIPREDVNTTQLHRYGLHFDGEHHKREDINTMSNAMQRREVRTVSTFFSNFSEHVLTAPLHSTFVSSRVVQCHGSKTWFFFRPDCCNDFGHHLYFGATIGKGFPPNAVMDLVTTRPGDVLTFGSFQHHLVLTHKGPSFMQTHRIVNWRVLLHGIRNFGQPFISSWLDAMRNNKGKTTANQAQQHPLRVHCENGMEEGIRLEIVQRCQQMGFLP